MSIKEDVTITKKLVKILKYTSKMIIKTGSNNRELEMRRKSRGNSMKAIQVPVRTAKDTDNLNPPQHTSSFATG